jgi:hypothetical protein|tara:strand:- start:1067 stop:1765 length:699 start_codon:yes stop_codon:yes gene_type:complete
VPDFPATKRCAGHIAAGFVVFRLKHLFIEVFVDCYGGERRAYIVKNYEIKPVAHVKLISGQKKVSCTNQTLSDSYYCFEYVSRIYHGDKGTFFCGSHAADDFLRKAGIRPLPLFNPLVSTGSSAGGGGASGTGQWNPLAKQLNDAINMIVVCWDIVPKGPLADIQSNLLRYRSNEPFPPKIKAINTVLSYDKQGRTLQQMIDQLRQNDSVRQFNFNLINNVLEAEGVSSNFG